MKLSAEIGWKALRDSVSHMSDGKFTELVWPLGDEDPDDAFSSVPYEKVSVFSPAFISLGIQLFVSLGIHCWHSCLRAICEELY